MVDDHDLEGMESELAQIRKRTGKDFYLAAIRVQDWNADLSPWPALLYSEKKASARERRIHCRKY